MTAFDCPICGLACRTWKARAIHLTFDHAWCGGLVRAVNAIDYSLGRRVIQDASEAALKYEYPSKQHALFFNPMHSRCDIHVAGGEQ